MTVTISTHNGSNVAREHNVRNLKVVSKEQHIDIQGIHETWIDEPIREAYERLFGQSVTQYNAKQSRPERRIKNYYNDICKDSKKHPVYEMIIGIYGKNENDKPICSTEQGKDIMKRFVENWKNRNPNLELIGAYYHADEDGEPHVHIDYIPIAHGYKKGLETQTGLVKALGEQGFEKSGKATAQIQWQKRENDYLTNLCETVGLTVEHPKIQGREHLETQLFKLTKRVEELEQAEKIATERFLNADIKVTEAEQRVKCAEADTKNAEIRANKAEQKLKEMNVQYKVVATELKDILNKKSRASEIRKSFFDREIQSYHANMIESTRAIGSEAYNNIMEAKKILQKAELMKLKTEQKEQEIAPLHEKAKELLQSAENDRNEAKKCKENEQQLILSKAKELSKNEMKEAFSKTSNRRSTRLEEYCKSITFNDGTNILDAFEQREMVLQRELEEKERTRKKYHGYER